MPSDHDQIANLDAELDALSSPTTEEVWARATDYDAGIVAASAARRALNAGGGSLPAGGSTGEVLTKASGADGDADWEAPSGGSQPGAVRVLKHDFDFSQAVALAAGVPVWTPAVGDWLLDAWIETDTSWNVNLARAKADIGVVAAGAFTDAGFFALNNGPVEVDASNWVVGSAVAYFGGSAPLPVVSLSQSQMQAIAVAGGLSGIVETRFRFLTTDPLQLVVSNDGQPGSTPTDADAGTSTLFIVVSSPVATP